MAGYSGRNHDYVAGLNALPSEYELSMQNIHHGHHQHQPGYDFTSDLDMFTNTQFLDLDMGEVPETNSPSSHDGEQWPVHGSAYMNDPNSSGYNPNFPTGAVLPYPGYTGTNSSSATTPSGLKAEGELKAGPGGLPQHMEEASRLAVEEDKRRRNTAASARFRVKKKQREQALEKAAKDMTDRVTYLENRVSTLEMENKLLKDLITEKSGPSAGADLDLLRKRAENQRRSESEEERRRRDAKQTAAER